MARTTDESSIQFRIELSKVLLVEGNDDRRFFGALLKKLEASSTVQVLDYGGKDKLRPFLQNLPNVPGFPDLDSLGITRDADCSFGSTIESVCNSLDSSELDVPQQAIVSTQGKPRVSIFILPDCESPGMLETLCLSAVQGDRAMPCVEEYLECLSGNAGMPARNPDKARAHAFLASRSRPELSVGDAAKAGHWCLDSPVYDPLKQFLLAL